MSDAPIKKCDYCDNTGKMPTFRSGETICYSCLSKRPKTLAEATHVIEQLQQQLTDRLNKQLIPWVMGLGLATGHADTEDELLNEVGEQIKELQKQLAEKDKRLDELEEFIRMIKCTEDSYDDEQTVLGEIYLMCEKAIAEGGELNPNWCKGCSPDNCSGCNEGESK